MRSPLRHPGAGRDLHSFGFRSTNLLIKTLEIPAPARMKVAN